MSVHGNGEDPLAAFEQQLEQARHGEFGGTAEAHMSAAGDTSPDAPGVTAAADRVQAAADVPGERADASGETAAAAGETGARADTMDATGAGAPEAARPGAPNVAGPGAPEAAQAAAAEAQVPPAVVLQRPPMWQRRLEAGGLALLRWVVRPRVRLTLLGALLVALAIFAVSSSLWSLVLGVVGAAMIITAWLGHRLEGHVGVSWGSSGTDFTFRFHVAPAHTVELHPVLLAGDPPETARPVAIPEPETIEGEAHTVEIDVEELKALIAAAEAAEAAAAASAAASSAAASTPVIRALRTERGSAARP